MACMVAWRDNAVEIGMAGAAGESPLLLLMPGGRCGRGSKAGRSLLLSLTPLSTLLAALVMLCMLCSLIMLCSADCRRSCTACAWSSHEVICRNPAGEAESCELLARAAVEDNLVRLRALRDIKRVLVQQASNLSL